MFQVNGFAVEQGDVEFKGLRTGLDIDPFAGAEQRAGTLDGEARVDVPMPRITRRA